MPSFSCRGVLQGRKLWQIPHWELRWKRESGRFPLTGGSCRIWVAFQKMGWCWSWLPETNSSCLQTHLKYTLMRKNSLKELVYTATCFLLSEFWCALGCPCSTSETALAERHIFQSEANLEEIIQNFAYFLLLKGRNCFFISTNKTRQLDFQVFVGLLFNCCWFRARRKFHFSKSTFPFRSIGQDLWKHLKNISRTSLCLS